MQLWQKIRKQVNRHPNLFSILVIILIALLAYLPGINTLGYYRDDWHVAWGGTLLGPQKIIDLHLTDRPLMGVIYAATFSLLGNNVIVWHLYSVLLRILGALAVYGVFNTVWPSRKPLNYAMSVLFVIYPGFLQLPTASAYSNHVLGLLCGFLAIELTLLAYQARQRYAKLALLLLSMPFALICFGIMEWMMGIEAILIGLLIIRVLADEPFQYSWAWFSRILFYSIPSLVVFFAFYSWRFFFFSSARSVTDIKSLGNNYLQHPVEMILRLLVEPLRGFWNSLVLAWGIPIYDVASTVAAPVFLSALILALFGVVCFLLFRQTDNSTSISEENAMYRTSNLQMLIGGLVFIFAGILPVIIGNREVLLQNTFDRYTLLASLGVVLVIGSGFSLLFSDKIKTISLCVLLSISIMTQVLNTRYFTEFWNAERNVWWQLSWRAPDLKSGTVLLPYLPLQYRLAESYEIWGPANLIYRHENPLDISGEVINQQTLHWIRSGDSYGKTIRRVDVTMDFSNNLLLGYPGNGSCLHVYGKEYNVISEFDDVTLDYLTPYSSWDQILSEATVTPSVPSAIFGEEPVHGWCFYYQKASLAYQQGDWNEIVQLGDEAAENGFQPNDEMEWLPFYEGYARSGQYEEANRIGEILRINKSISEQFCKVYESKVNNLNEQETYMVVNICPQFERK